MFATGSLYRRYLSAFILIAGATAMALAAPGDLDTTFNMTGKVTTDIATGNDAGRGVAIQADGKIVVVGVAVTDGNSDAALVRYNTDGSLDQTFGVGGKVITQFFTRFDELISVQILPDQKILALGRYQFTNANSGFLGVLARYDPNGSLDTTFGGGDGFAQVLMEQAIDMAIQPDGKIIAAGWQANGVNATQSRQQRFNPDGTVDNTFGNGIGGPGTNVIQYDTFSTTDHDARAIAIQPDGKIVVGGCRASGSCIYGLARLLPNGMLDNTFDEDGRVTTPGSGVILDLIIQPDGKILAIGQVTEDFNVTRYNTDGSLDTSFGTNGRVTTPFLGIDAARAGVLRPDGKILVAGGAGGVDSNFALARYNPNGTLDPTFSGDGKVTIDFGATGESAQGLAMDTAGRLVLSGVSSNLFAVARVLQEEVFTPQRPIADFDGDGRSDLSVFRPMPDPAENYWYIKRSSDSELYQHEWGLENDHLAAADYDGDGNADLAVWREDPTDPDRATFYILNSSDGSFRTEQFGRTGDVPSMVGDWDGDGTDDPAVYRPGTGGGESVFFYRPSSQPEVDFNAINWGTTNDRPIRGDFDGDGILDAAVFRPSDSTWYIRESSTGQPRYDNWGTATDKFVVADYDGDGKTDLAVFRSGVWYIKNSLDGQPRYEPFGTASDIPVPADYDGDGSVDIAIYRNGIWYINQSTGGFTAFGFGLATDRPVPGIDN